MSGKKVKCFLVEKTEEMEPTEYGFRPVYKRMDTGELIRTQLPVGAMFFNDPEYNYPTGPDGRSLTVVTPGGWWYVDSGAYNCTKPDDTVHRCWCRHGEVPNITVDKIGNTCNAGAGSIQMGTYHGFLQNGELTNC